MNANTATAESDTKRGAKIYERGPDGRSGKVIYRGSDPETGKFVVLRWYVPWKKRYALEADSAAIFGFRISVGLILIGSKPRKRA